MTNTASDSGLEPARQWGLFATCAAIFIGASAATVWLCDTPACCSTIPMPGGWSLSTLWTPASGQSWLAAGGSFVGMWIVMMMAMMLPSLSPILMNCRRRGGETVHATLVAGGYFFIWTIVGVVLFPAGAMLAHLALRSESISRAMPVASGVALLLTGLNQFAPWKSRQLDCCRAQPPSELDSARALRFGLHLGAHCVGCCLGFMLMLMVLGVMNLTAMLLVTIGITLERLVAHPIRIARGTGAAIAIAGLVMIGRRVHLV
jgi:predicted metal-binding membrane protein